MLYFSRLRLRNVLRCERDFKHPLSLWSVAEWGNATAGECGEACNVAKKILRINGGLHNMNNKTKADYVKELADELADTLIYLDLWAASEGIDLEEAVRKKFNEDSIKRNSSVQI
jgi:NTP pyrophosphatase (non-canonical NTP hydrolase)